MTQPTRAPGRLAMFVVGLTTLAAVWLAADTGPSGPTLRRVAARPSAPNILILVGDDHFGGSLGIDGDPRQATPNLDRLAREGVRFDRAYCNAPMCTPSRQSFITGRLPHAVGVTQLASVLSPQAITLGDWFDAHGYETAAYGKMHFNGRHPHGFGERLDTPDWRAHLRRNPPLSDQQRPWRPFREPAEAWLNARARSWGLPARAMESSFYADRALEFFRRRRDRPFALVVGFYETHAPFPFPNEWVGRYQPDQFDAPEVSEDERGRQPRVFAKLGPEQVRGVRAAYFQSLSWLDHVVGRILDGLEEAGQADNTIVVYLGDNGYLLGQHGRFEKHDFHEPAVRVPLIVRWPTHLPEGRRVTELVELVDLMPTLTELCGLPDPPDLHGQSLAPLLRAEPGARGREVAISTYAPNEEAMVRSDRYKLIVGSGRKRRRDGYANGRPAPGPYERLYDLEADPGETTDLAGRSELAPVIADLRHRLHDRLVTTRAGLRPVPEGLGERDAIHWCLVPRDK